MVVNKDFVKLFTSKLPSVTLGSFWGPFQKCKHTHFYKHLGGKKYTRESIYIVLCHIVIKKHIEMIKQTCYSSW